MTCTEPTKNADGDHSSKNVHQSLDDDSADSKGPKEYINARASNLDRVEIDGWPYCPKIMADGSDPSSAISVVATLFQLDDTERSALSASRISGGITNVLFKVDNLKLTIHQKVINGVLVRIFGGEGMIDRDVENTTYAALSAAGVAPAYYGRFGNGRLEGWLEMRPVKIRELSDPSISNAIAVATGTFHSRFHVPRYLKAHHNPSKPSLWTQLDSWLEQALSSTFQNKHDTKRAEALNIIQLRDELSWLKAKVIPTNAQVGFCHNDILGANVLWDEAKKRAQLIDFEYGGINYLSFDIANHFNEFAGGTDGDGKPHYEWLPSNERKEQFILNYLKAKSGKNEMDNHEISEKQVSTLLDEIEAFMLANHLYWGLWGVNQAATEGCESFDYLLYGSNRIKQYFVVKGKSFDHLL